MSVAIIESSSGQGRNCRDLHNHFGIVGRNTLARHTRYKQYASDGESFRDFCKLIARKNFYPTLRGKSDPVAWAEAISKTGYSEQPATWRSKVVTVLQSHRL